MRRKDRFYKTFIKTLLFLYILFKPIYLFPSGLPQISDFLLLFLFVLLFFNSKCRIMADGGIKYTIRRIIPFIIWVTVINVLWAIALPSSALLRPILFYLFNYIAMIVIYKLYLLIGDNLFKNIVIYTSISLIIQFVFVVLTPSSSVRATGFFNNPNQLGLYALVVITILLFLKSKLDRMRYLPYLAIFCSMYLILVSLSKAAMLGLFVLLLLVFILNNKRRILNVIVLIIAALTIITGLGDAFYEKISSVPIVKTAATKIIRMSNENDSDLGTGRGYNRLNEIGLNIIEGVGEGEFARFESLSGSEIHSAYASILCYYGIIGFALLFSFIIFVFGKNYNNYILMSGILLYGLTHQIWRNTLIWMLIALIIILNYQNRVKKNEENNNSCISQNKKGAI